MKEFTTDLDQKNSQSRQQSLNRLVSDTHFVFGPNVRAAMSASRSEVIRVQTRDCFQGLITEDPDTHQNISNDIPVPVTGPVYIDDADIGDVLCVQIQQINFADTGVFAIRPKTGIIGRDIQSESIKILPLKSNKVGLGNGINIPIQPVVGIIGVAPRHGEIETVYPGRHGGNMDTVEITTGSRVYLPVQVKGALLSIGDVKASMGDGQVAGSGVEAAAEVIVRIDTMPGGRFSWPRVETKDALITVTSASSVDQAARLAVSEMIKWLEQEKGLDFETAYTLVGLSGALRISQWTNPLITARISFPKSVVRKIRSKSAPSGRPMFLTTMPSISDTDADSTGLDESDGEVAATEASESGSDSGRSKSSSRSGSRRRRRRPSGNKSRASQKQKETNSDDKNSEDTTTPAPEPAESLAGAESGSEDAGVSAESSTDNEKTDGEQAEKKTPPKRRYRRRKTYTRRSSSGTNKGRTGKEKPSDESPGADDGAKPKSTSKGQSGSENPEENKE